MSAAPKVSIGVPAYNSAATLGSSLESLLGQTFGDFELIVSDNASTDATREVAEGFAQRDSRVRYVRQAENIGANGNYSFLARAARGEYFKWASSSDLCAPPFVEKCVAALEKTPDAVIAAPRTSLFSGDVDAAVPYQHDIELLDALPSVRLRRLNATLRLNNAMNGLIRAEALRRTRLIERFYQADIVLLGNLALLGKILRVDEHLYYRRMEVATSTLLQDDEAWRRHHYPKLSASVLFQSWKRSAAWLRACLAAPMPATEKARVLAFCLRMCNWHRGDLWHDLGEAATYFAGGRGPR